MKKLILTALAAIVAVGAFAQTDLGLWTEASADFGLGKKWNLGIEGEIRTCEGLSSFDRWSLGASAEFQPVKVFGLGAGYIFIDTHKEESTTKKGNIVDEYWRIKNRLFFQTKFKFKPSILRIGLRLRYQYTKEKEVSIAKYSSSGERKSNEVKAENSENILRTKLNVGFKTNTRLTPYVAYEIQNCLDDSFGLKKQRVEGGTAIKLNKHNELEVSYKRNIYKDDDDDKTHNVIGIAYKFKL